MKKLQLLLLLWGVALIAQAQTPDWVNASARQERYPDQMYLVGFSSDENTQNENPEKFLKKQTDYARVQVVQAIQVQIESKVTNDMTIRNGDVDQTFQQSSVSLATAEIAGLEYKTYYDPAKKIGYAIAFAKRSDLISYYREKLKNQISALPQKIQQAESLMQNDDKQGALRTYYECMPIFPDIEEAQAMLIALGIKTSELHIQEVSDYKTKVQAAISKLQNSDNLTISQLAYFLAYGLHLQTGEVENQVYAGKLTFQDTEMESEFSKRFYQEFIQNLVKAGKYKVKEGTYNDAVSKKGFYSNYYVEGTYWPEAGKIKVLVLMRDSKTGRTKASAEASISESWLKENNLPFIPKAIKKIEEMADMKIMTINANYEVKVTEVARKPIEAFAVIDEEGTEQIPIRFKYLADGQEIANGWSDAEGRVSCILTGIQPSTKTIVIVAELDVAAYLGLDKRSNYARKLSETRQIPSTRIFAKILGPTAYFELRETDLNGHSMQVPFIEPKLKEALSEKGFTFTNSPSGADLMITVNAKARRGNQVSGLYFAFVDANVTIMDLATAQEIFKNAYTDIKGGSANWDRANAKAYEPAAKQITAEILGVIETKH